MKTLLGLLRVCGCAALIGWGTASADPIDDLLSGKAVLIDEAAVSSEEAAVFGPQADDTLPAEIAGASPADAAVPAAVVAAPQAPAKEPSVEEQLATDPSWNVGLKDSSNFSLDLEVPPSARRGSSLPTPFTVVPEPSAIALAAASLVYFLIFFRRRYSL